MAASVNSAKLKLYLCRDIEWLRAIFADTYLHQPPMVENAMGIQLTALLRQFVAACAAVDELAEVLANELLRGERVGDECFGENDDQGNYRQAPEQLARRSYLGIYILMPLYAAQSWTGHDISVAPSKLHHTSSGLLDSQRIDSTVSIKS